MKKKKKVNRRPRVRGDRRRKRKSGGKRKGPDGRKKKKLSRLKGKRRGGEG